MNVSNNKIIQPVDIFSTCVGKITKHQRIAFLVTYLSAIVIFSLHFFVAKGAVYGDGRYYYVYLPSILLEHTINLTHAFSIIKSGYVLTAKHIPENMYDIGAPLFWSIPFLLTHFFISFFVKANGYQLTYQFIIGIWNISAVFTGLYCLFLTLRKFFSEKVSLLTVIILFLSTNLLFYGAVDVLNSHSTSFFASSLFLYFLFKKITVKNSIMMGVFLGLLNLTRSQEILFFIFPIFLLIRNPRQYYPHFIIVTLSAILTFSPQLVIWYLMSGSWLGNPYFHAGTTFYLSHPQILGVLFNKSDGLFLWTPSIIIAVTGLIYFAKNNRKTGIPMVLLFSAEFYTIASWSTWWEGSSYSARMLVSGLPFLAFGFAYLLSQERWYKLTLSISSFLCILNPMLIVVFLRFVK